MNKIKDFFLEHIIAFLYACYAERKLNHKLKELEKKEFNPEKWKVEDLDRFIKELRGDIQKAREHKKVIEDKATASLFIISLSITIILGSLDFIEKNDSGAILKNSIVLLLIAGVIYLLMAGVASIQALITRKFYDESLEDLIKEEGNNLKVADLDNMKRLGMYYKNVKLNQLVTIIRSNFVYASFIDIRNGIILFSIIFVMVVGNTFLSNLGRSRIDSEKIIEFESQISQLKQQVIQQQEAEMKELTTQAKIKQMDLDRMGKKLESFYDDLNGLREKINSAEKDLDVVNKKIDSFIVDQGVTKNQLGLTEK